MPTMYGQVAGRKHGGEQRLTKAQECEPSLSEMAVIARKREERIEVSPYTKRRAFRLFNKNRASRFDQAD